MRRLNKKQRNMILDYWLDMEKHLYYSKEELLEELEKVNDYETLWCDLDRILNDLNFSDNPEETINKFN